MAKYCKYCGEEIPEGEFCKCQEEVKTNHTEKDSSSSKPDELLNAIKQRIGLQTISSAAESFERDKKIVPDCIIPDDGEIPIRQYHIATLRSLLKGMYAEGRLQVTNKRVLFRAAGISFLGTTELQHEFAIEEIAGIEIRRDHRIGVLNVVLAIAMTVLLLNISSNIMEGLNNVSNILANILAILLAVGAVAGFFATKGKFFLKLLGLSIAAGAVSEVGFYTKYFILPVSDSLFFTVLEAAVAVLLLLCMVLTAFVPNLVVAIKTKGASSPIEIRRKESNGILAFVFNMPKKDYTGFTDAMPGRDTAKAMKELGALINDIHVQGDGALENWKEN